MERLKDYLSINKQATTFFLTKLDFMVWKPTTNQNTPEAIWLQQSCLTLVVHASPWNLNNPKFGSVQS
jgi:hypothetical protein